MHSLNLNDMVVESNIFRFNHHYFSFAGCGAGVLAVAWPSHSGLGEFHPKYISQNVNGAYYRNRNTKTSNQHTQDKAVIA